MRRKHLNVLKKIKEECMANKGYCEGCSLHNFCCVNGNIESVPAIWNLKIYELEEGEE